MPHFSQPLLRSAFLAAGLLAVTSLTAPAQAQSDSGLALGVTAGTDGIAAQASYMFGSNFGLRVKGSWFRISRGVDTSTVHYDGKLRPQTFDLLADLYPFDSGFRISGGGVYNRNRLELVATPTAGKPG